MTEPEDTCQPVEVDGEIIRVRGSGDLTPEGEEALAALVRAAKAEAAGELQQAERRADIADDVTAHTKDLMGRRTETLRKRAEEAERKLSESELLGHRLLQRAERAEEELVAARAQLNRSENARYELRTRLKQTEDRAEAASVVGTQHMAAAEQTEAAIERVVAAVHIADEEDVTDWQRGYRACSERAVAALHTQPGPAATEATNTVQYWTDQAAASAEQPDGAYRERAHLVALLAAMTDGAVIAPAPDVDEPGWQIAYLNLGGRQASWHISPRDAELFAKVEHVPADDPRAQWDGHTTEEKYAGIAAYTVDLMATCGLECSEMHTETGRCEIARNR